MGRLFWKFFLVCWLVTMTAVGIVTTVILLQQNSEVTNARQSLIDVGKGAPFVSAASLVLQHGGVADLQSFLEELNHQPIPPVFAVNELGEELLDRKLSPGILGQIKTKSNPYEVRDVKANDGQNYRIFMVSTEHLNASPLGVIKLPLRTRREPPPIWLPIILGVCISLISSSLLAWYLAKPIRHLRSAFVAVANGNLNTRVGDQMSNRHDELADLGNNFDHMVSQIQMLVDAQQRLMHDVSHELRSPLARMQVAIGLAHQQPDKLTVTLERIERESQRMSDLVGELLVLSRLEAGVVGNLEAIEIIELIAEIVEDARFEASSKNVEIEFSGCEEIYLKGHRELIHRAIENVLRNAVQHTKIDSIISVETRLDKTNGEIKIVISDQGDGIAENELAAIFEPFFRGAHTKKINSVGLGLTIALKAIQFHKGEIKAINKHEGGLEVAISLPIHNA